MADSWEDIDKQPKKATGGLNPAASSFSFNPQVASWAPPGAAAGVCGRQTPHASRDSECTFMWPQNNRGMMRERDLRAPNIPLLLPCPCDPPPVRGHRVVGSVEACRPCALLWDMTTVVWTITCCELYHDGGSGRHSSTLSIVSRECSPQRKLSE